MNTSKTRGGKPFQPLEEGQEDYEEAVEHAEEHEDGQAGDEEQDLATHQTPPPGTRIYEPRPPPSPYRGGLASTVQAGPAKDYKTNWKGHPIPHLEGGTFTWGHDPEGIVRLWQEDAVLAIVAATGGQWLTELILRVERKDPSGKGTQLLLKDPDDPTTAVDVLEKFPSTPQNKAMIVKIAMRDCGAPIHTQSWSTVSRAHVNIDQAYATLMTLLTEFNDQMRKATNRCNAVAIPYQMAKRAHTVMRPNMWEGIAVWKLLDGASGQKQVRVDELLDHLRAAGSINLQRAVDVSGALGCINEYITDLTREGKKEDELSHIVLPKLLETLSDGQYVEPTHGDVKAWRRIGAAAALLKQRRDNGECVLWTEVHTIILRAVTAGLKDAKGPSTHGPASKLNTSNRQIKMPLGIALAALENNEDVDVNQMEPQVALAAEAFARPATIEEYRRMIQTGTPITPVKFKRQKPSPTNQQTGIRDSGSRGGGESGAPSGERPPMPHWRCQAQTDGMICKHLNYHYARASKNDHTPNGKCQKCGAPRPKLGEQACAAFNTKAPPQKQANATLQPGTKQNGTAKPPTSSSGNAPQQPSLPVSDTANAAMASSGNDFGCMAIDGRPTPTFAGMRISGSEEDMAFCAQLPPPIANNIQPLNLKQVGCDGMADEDHSPPASTSALRRSSWLPLAWLILYVSSATTMAYEASTAVWQLGSACMHAFWPTPYSMWRTLHGLHAIGAEQARTLKDAAWYLLLLLLMYAACANAYSTGAVPHTGTNGIARHMHAALGAALLTPTQRQHRQYCMLAANVKGPALFLDSCCSRTIISDASLLRNIRMLSEPRMVNGLTGVKAIRRVGDLHMPMTNRQGQRRTEVIKDVYYDPGISYNLVSLQDVADAEYTTTFSPHHCTMSGPGGIFDIIKTSNRVFALPIHGPDGDEMSCAAVGLSAEEYMHLKFNHAISYRRLAQMSRDNVPGIPPGLKDKRLPCHVCQHANIVRNDAPPAATGTDDADCHFDMADMSQIPTINGFRYCTVFVMTATRYAYTYMHAAKDEHTIAGIMDRFLGQFADADKPRTFKSDCAAEYQSPAVQSILTKHNIVAPLRHSNEHQQFQNGKAEKFIDTLGRRIRAALLQSQMPPEFWGAAAMLMTDIYNCTPHDSLHGDSPFKRARGHHPDVAFIKPFGCAAVVHRGRDLVEHSKLAPRGEKCVYIGTGQTFGRRAYLAYSPRLNRVFATVDVQFDETYFPFRLVDQRVLGWHSKQPQLEQLSLFHDLPHPTIPQLIQRINGAHVPGADVTWPLCDLVQAPPAFEAASNAPPEAELDNRERTRDSGEHTRDSGERTRDSGERTRDSGERTRDSGDSGDSGESGEHPDSSGLHADPYGLHDSLDHDPSFVTGANLRMLQKTVFAQGPPGAYGEAQQTDAWRRNTTKLIKDLTNEELAECLIGMEARITCPERFWPSDKVSWTVQVMEHHADGRARGGHRFHVVLLHSTPPYRYKPGEPQQYDALLSAWHLRSALAENHAADTQTLQLMFGAPAHTPLTTAAYAAVTTLRRQVARLARRVDDRLRCVESAQTAEAALMAMTCAAMLCDEQQVPYSGLRPEPRHFYDIAKRPDAERWYAACDVEIAKLFDMGAFDIVDTPHNHKVMECCFSFKTKYDSAGRVLEYRARGNVDGSKQEPGTFGDTFAPTSKFSCIRTICALAAQEGMHLYQFDIKGAFLMAPCKEDIYLNFPGKYRLPPGKCLKCRSYVYGLKQSAARWHELFSGWLKAYGFTNLDDDGVTYIKCQPGPHGQQSKIVLSMHVDDGLAASNDPLMYQSFMTALKKDFELSDCGELSWLLGCKVEQDREAGTVRLTQEKYCNDVLKRFQMHECSPAATPCEANMHLSADDCPPLHARDPAVVRNYQQCVGACMYLTCFTRGDCSFAVNQCARFMHNPGPTHIAAIKRVLRYLAGTRTRGITYRRDTIDASAVAMDKSVLPNHISACADADHAGAHDRRSVSGYAVMLAGAMVMWTSKRQPVTAISSTESEFYSVSQCALDCVYLRRVLELLGYPQQGPTLIAQDNNACIYLVKGAGMYQRAKHIDTRIYRVRELAAAQAIELYKIPGDQQPADLFTKGLPKPAFERHRRALMGE